MLIESVFFFHLRIDITCMLTPCQLRWEIWHGYWNWSITVENISFMVFAPKFDNPSTMPCRMQTWKSHSAPRHYSTVCQKKMRSNWMYGKRHTEKIEIFWIKILKKKNLKSFVIFFLFSHWILIATDRMMSNYENSPTTMIWKKWTRIGRIAIRTRWKCFNSSPNLIQTLAHSQAMVRWSLGCFGMYWSQFEKNKIIFFENSAKIIF